MNIMYILGDWWRKRFDVIEVNIVYLQDYESLPSKAAVLVSSRHGKKDTESE